VKTNIGLDLKKNGRCDFTIAKELFFSFGAGLAIPKSKDIEYYSRGQVTFIHKYNLISFLCKRIFFI
jgi:hypothetical protein